MSGISRDWGKALPVSITKGTQLGWGGGGREVGTVQVTDPGGQRVPHQVTGWESELAGGGWAGLTSLICDLCGPTGLCMPKNSAPGLLVLSPFRNSSHF